MSSSSEPTAQPSRLPIEAALPALIEALAKHSRIVLEAPPGAGKSTYLPLWLRARGATPTKRIVLLQPRRLAADNVARFLARKTGTALGEVVGLRTRFDHYVSPNTVIEVLTEGVFLRQLQRDPELAQVGWVLFDEFHERSWQADLCLSFALESQQQWREASDPLTLLVMSATLDTKALASWLDAPIVRAQGRSFEVQVVYSAPGRLSPEDHAVAQINQALEGGARKILVFLAGWGPMQRLGRRLEGRSDCAVQWLHSQVAPEQQQRALRFDPSERPDVVLATNIAETSLTIEGVDTVIDSGQVRRANFDPARGMDRLDTGWICLASAQQRAGRAGRQGPGRCIRLWSQEQQGRLLAHDPAQIEQVDLAPLALELALWASPTLRLLDAPPPQRLAQAQALLRELGALDANCQISARGRAMAELGLHPRLGALVLQGRGSADLKPACELAALLSEGDFLRADRDNPISADIDWRLQLLRSRGSGAGAAVVQNTVVRRIAQLATQLQQRARVGRQGLAQGSASASTGALLLAAYPDRLARRREEGSSRYLTRDGFEVVLDNADPLRRERWLVITDHDGDRRGARVRLAAAVADPDIDAILGAQIEIQEMLTFDEARQAIAARRVRRLGPIVLDETPIGVTAAAAASLWLELLQARGLEWLQWSPAVLGWLARVRFAKPAHPDWPDFADAALLAQLPSWLAPHLGEMRRLEQLRGLNWLELLQQRLDYRQAQALARYAPAQFTLPSKLAHAIDYAVEGPPRLAARMQEFFGLNEHPRVGQGSQPLLLELLSPAQRPVQVTQDLPGFWRGSYPEVRRDLRGRYPKHFWPEEPWAAPATAVIKKRMPAQPK